MMRKTIFQACINYKRFFTIGTIEMLNGVPPRFWQTCRNQSTAPKLFTPASHERQIIAATKLWIKEWVVVHQLCPWAEKTMARNDLVIDVCYENGLSQQSGSMLLEALLDNMSTFSNRIHEDPDDKTTVMVVLPNLSSDFRHFLDVVELVQDIIVDMKIEDIVQIATFHPCYTFGDEGVEIDDVVVDSKTENTQEEGPADLRGIDAADLGKLSDLEEKEAEMEAWLKTETDDISLKSADVDGNNNIDDDELADADTDTDTDLQPPIDIGADDVKNYTNRSPYAMIQLLNVNNVTAAIAAYNRVNKDSNLIWQRNIRTMEKVGLDAARQALIGFQTTSHQNQPSKS